MPVFYSPSSNGFYDTLLCVPPEDAIQITDELHAELLDAQSVGKVIAADEQGNPIAADRISLLTLDQAKAQQIGLLTNACAAAIVGGYKSSALGAHHTYPSGITDQINMMGSVTASLLPELPEGWLTPFWCRDDAGNWGYGMHSAAQIQQAGSDGKAHVVSCQTQLATLSAEVMTATDIAAVTAVAWVDV